MRISNPEEIETVFSMFHDGTIIKLYLKDGDVYMEIDICYLAERVNPKFENFTVKITKPSKLQIELWNDEAKVITDLKEIEQLKLGILSCERTIGSIFKIACTTDFEQSSGGSLSFTTTSIEVFDEIKKAYSFQELLHLANGYWEDWIEESCQQIPKVKRHS